MPEERTKGEKEKGAEKIPTTWELVLLSAFLPGAGQYFTGHIKRCLLFAIPSGILFVDIMVRSFILLQMVFAPVMAGEPLFVTDDAFTVLISLFPLLGIAFAIWAAALADTILIAKKMEKEREDEASGQ